MDIVLFVLVFINLVNLILTSLNLYIRLRQDKVSVTPEVPDVPPLPQTPDIPPDEDSTSIYLSRAEEDRIFDARITRLKNEVSERNPIKHTPSEAEVLHPGVYNLPHDAMAQEIYPDVEVAE